MVKLDALSREIAVRERRRSDIQPRLVGSRASMVVAQQLPVIWCPMPLPVSGLAPEMPIVQYGIKANRKVLEAAAQ